MGHAISAIGCKTRELQPVTGSGANPRRNRPGSSGDESLAHPLGLSEQGGLRGDTNLDIARRLLAHARVVSGGADALSETNDRVYDRLRLHLVEVLGTSGYRFLLARAIVTAHANASLVIGADDRLRNPGGSALGPTHLPAVESTLAAVFDLLSEIVGQNLVLRLIHQAWPTFDLLPPFHS